MALDMGSDPVIDHGGFEKVINKRNKKLYLASQRDTRASLYKNGNINRITLFINDEYLTLECQGIMDKATGRRLVKLCKLTKS